MKIRRMATEVEGNVILVEPNELNTNQNMVNGIPQYQDMYIFAELTATSKGRTIIKNSNVNSTKSKIINFIGNNQNNDNPNNPDPNYLNFTTNYYDGSTDSETHYEGFGINSIKIVINSSFIPQVNIQFVDLRGLAFFNQKDSPYRILFDFPPPIFELTVKGYYGKPLKYSLHLVKYTSEFSAQNGNFIIDAQFVAMTFAPLSDILFRYVVNTPIIDNKDSLNPSTNTPPKNTFELILKLKSLYAAFGELRNTDEDIKEYVDAVNDLKKINEITNTLNDFTENAILNNAGTPLMVARLPASKNYIQYPAVPDDIKDSVSPLNTVQGFDTYISQDSSSGKRSRMNNRLYIVYEIGRDYPEYQDFDPTFKVPQYYEYADENYSGFDTALNKYKDMLLSQKLSSTYYDSDAIIKPDPFVLNYDVQNNTNVNTKYYGMDITGYYTTLYKKKVKLDKKIVELEDDVIAKINSLVARELGMRPSIYNIFNVILGDVDAFFTKLKKVSNDAYDEHQKDKKIIINSGSYGEGKDKDEDAEIFAFPLIINSSFDNRQERVAPIDLALKVRFPELELVDDFIDTFLDQKIAREQYELRDNQNDSGENNWIPISPFDSTLGGATPQSPYAGTNNNVRDETLKILLTRFYILTQGTIPQSFYEEPTGRRWDKESVIASAAYSSLYGQAEAINLISSITNEENRQTLAIMSEEYVKTKLGQFYKDISGLTVTYDDGTPEGKTGSLSNFPTNDPKQFSVTPKSKTEGRVYLDKYNANFEGVVIHDGVLRTQDTSEESDNPVDNFSHDAGKGKWYKQDPAEHFFAFTSENLLYIKDWSIESEDKFIDSGGQICTFTRYLCDHVNKYLTPPHGDVKNFRRNEDFPGTGVDDVARQKIAYQEGNESFTYRKTSDRKFLNKGVDLLELWVSIFSNYDDEIINTIEGSSNLGSVVLLSNFGYTLSPFNIYPTALNPTVFDTPAAIEVPQYFAPYIGALLTANEEGWVDEILDYFTGGTGSQFINRGFFVLADLHDVEKYLSEEDKITFKREYTAYMRTGGVYNTSVENIRSLYDVVAQNPAINKLSQYGYYLSSKGEKVEGLDGNQGQSMNIIADQLIRNNIINYGQITFKMSEEYHEGYTSIETLNADPTNKFENRTKNDKFFTALFQKFSALAPKKGQELIDREEAFGKVRGGSDIKNQLYYSFKNINDKWLTGTAKGVPNYPFNGPTNKLMDMFAFVDRGMNPIGETIINGEILVDMLEDPNISLFSVLTQLLSLNGFEFFPLQNFLRINDDKAWEDSFKIHTAGYDDVENTYFVCMYIGGSSSYPTVSGNGFTNDGILNIAAPGLKGFNGPKPTEKEIADLQKQDFDILDENQKQIVRDNFPFNEVRAFRVRFGEQNQSMFTDIKIDSKEYPETNESIQILSRIAGDGSPNAPVPQGQSLYNLYENRSYRAVVTGFGNAMIQPTQYFQLENIPLFNGAYIILDVEHNITANKMTTTFGGTKLLEYPMPRVTSPVAFMNLENLSNGEGLASTLRFATQARFITQDTLDRQECVLGIDISHHNGVADWKKAKAAGVELGIIKLTQGTTFYSGNQDNYDIQKQANGAIDNDIPLGYYHFAVFGVTPSPVNDGRDQANWFSSKIGLFQPQKNKLPAILDLEAGEYAFPNGYSWSNRNEDINIFIKSFTDTMKANGYKTMLYVPDEFVLEYGIKNTEGYDLWTPTYYNPKNTPNAEVGEPPLPIGWKKWDIWQFSSQGRIEGVPPAGLPNAKGVDLNMVKKDFLKKYNA